MNADQLLVHYEQVADAPDAITHLRRFILDLAVRGKLVPQDPNDGEGKELLSFLRKARIEWEIARRIRKQKNDRTVDDAGRYLDIPKSWTWAMLYEIGQTQTGTSPSSNNADLFGDYIPFIKPGHMGGAKINYDGPGLSKEGIRHSRFVPANSILMVCIGATLGKVNKTTRSICFNQQINSLTIYLDGLADYIVLALKSSDFQKLAWSKASTGTLPIISKGKWEVLPIPLPPLAEQHRIVAKVDELMALDQLDVERKKRETTRDRLVAASLVRLNIPDPTAFREHAAFALKNLSSLTTRSDQIKALRQTILDLAVRGKLVPQDPNDEPASELLKRIVAKKAQLVREKKIKVRRASKLAICSEVPFNLPSGWSPAKIEQILVEIQTGPFGSSLHQSDYQLGGTPVINPASIQNGRIVPIDKMAVGLVTLERLASFKLQTGDIIMGRRGEMGRCAVISECERGWLCGTGSLILRPSEYLYPHFLSMMISSPFSRQYLDGTAVGTTMQNLNQTILLNLSFGLPPFAEQHRIVAKVDELMALCDRLEANLAIEDDIRCLLLDALLHEALE